MTLLSEILSSKVREKVFLNLFDGQRSELHMRELERRSGCSIGTIQTELQKLARLELVASRRDGNRLYYRANHDHPLYADICSLVAKTSGIIGQLRAVVAGREDVACAFVFGSLAAGKEGADSDIDLMVVGAIGLRSLVPLLVATAETTGREINPHVFSANELRSRIEQQDHFICNVMKATKVFIKGGDDDLGEMAGQRLVETT